MSKSSMDAVFDALIVRCVARGWARASDIQGCTDSEILNVAARQGVFLPAAYQTFLRRMGRGAGAFMGGADVFYPAPLGLREKAWELLAEYEYAFALPEDALVFWMHQSHHFMFVRTSEGSDPPVYYYLEGATEAVWLHEHFTDFLGSEIDIMADEEVGYYYDFLSTLRRIGR